MKSHSLSPILLLRLLSALPFAVFYSSLQLYLLDAHFSVFLSTAIVGSILALSFSTSLVGGLILNKYISYSAFFIFCIICQAIGCCSFITTNHSIILWLSSLFLLGSTGVTLCLNMIITRIYDSENCSREKAFFWLYMAVNIGYILGYSLTGYLDNIHKYYILPIITLFFSSIIVLIILLNRIKINNNAGENEKKPFFYFLIIMLLLFFTLRFLLQFPQETNIAIIISWGFAALTMFFILNTQYADKKNEIKIFYILLVATLVFWSAYFLAPMSLMIFIKTQVNLKIMGISIAPQWIQNINTIVLILGAVFLTKTQSSLFDKKSIVPKFSLGLLIMGLSFFVLSIGIHFSDGNNKVKLIWIITSYVLQGISELLIGPIGYSLVGRLIPEKYHNIMMGVWITILGVASALSSKLSNLVPYFSKSSLLVLSNYNHFFLLIFMMTSFTAFIIYNANKIIVNKPVLT